MQSFATDKISLPAVQQLPSDPAGLRALLRMDDSEVSVTPFGLRVNNMMKSSCGQSFDIRIVRSRASGSCWHVESLGPIAPSLRDRRADDIFAQFPGVHFGGNGSRLETMSADTIDDLVLLVGQLSACLAYADFASEE